MWDILRDHGLVLLIGDYPRGPLGGLAMTLVISVTVLVISFPLAILVALARTSGVKALEAPCTVFVYVVRSLPLLMLVFWVYYFVPAVTRVPVSAFATLVFSISVYQIAYMSEVVRASIEGLPRGQVEAASSLGMSYLSTTAVVVLPQALYACLPGLLSQFIIIVKETSLGYILAFNELTYAAADLNGILLVRPLEVFSLLAMIYFAINFSLSRAARRLDLRIARARQHQPAAPAEAA